LRNAPEVKGIDEGGEGMIYAADEPTPDTSQATE